MPVAVEEDERFETNQSNVAAFLVFCGHDIVEALWENESCTFLFDQNEDLARDFAEYVQGKARVEPVGFSTSYGQVMKIVKEKRRDHHAGR